MQVMDIFSIALISFYLVPCAQAQCNGGITIYTSADTDLISGCTTYDGNINIDTSASGNVTLESIETITGDLTARNSSIHTLSAPKLASIEGTFGLENLDVLHTLDLPLLAKANSLDWNALPLLEWVGFEEGLSQARTVHIYNTGLLTLSGFNLVLTDTIDISYNPSLETVDLQELENVTSLSFEENAPNLNLQFESLQFVFGNMKLANISGLATPDLQNVTGSFTCYSCAMATYRSTWLQTVGLEMAFVSTDLSTLEFPDMVEIGGGLQLSNNSNLRVLDGFPLLESVSGGMTLNGNFEKITFDGLGFLNGDVVLDTSSDNVTLCEYFTTLKEDETIRDQLTCRTNASLADTTNSTTGLDAGDGSHNKEVSNNLSGGVVAGIVIGVLAAVLLLAVGTFLLLRVKARRARLDSKTSSCNFQELPEDGSNEKVELHGSTRAATELEAQNGHGAHPRMIPGVYEVGDHVVHANELGDTSTGSTISPLDQRPRGTSTIASVARNTSSSRTSSRGMGWS